MVKEGLALVTGGAGFIGSHIVDRLLEEEWGVRVVDNFSSGKYSNLAHHKGNPMLEIIKCDLKDAETCVKVVEGVDVVFHYAANPEVRVSTTNPDIHFRENVVATFNLLEAMRKKDVGKLVFASSSSVYGEPERIPVNEDAPIKPASVYGASKAAGESLIHAYSKLYGIKSVVLRYANVIGPRLRHGIIYDIVRKLKRNSGILEVLGDGTQVRSYIYITDAVEATMLTFENMNNYYEVYNIGNEDWITVDEVVNAIIQVMGLRNVKIAHKPIAHGVGWPGDVKKIALSIDKLKKLGFKPRINSIEAVRRAAADVAGES